jgi:cyclohexanone monooxygenase
MNTQNASHNSPSPEHSRVEVVIVGAGFAGLYATYRARKLGMSVRCLEAGTGVGGTWFWNRYPGARCDVESLDYSYSFSPELQAEWHWSHRYAEQPEILEYVNHVADRFALRPHIWFSTRVTAMRFDEQQQAWEVTTDTGRRVTARFCIMASGNLSTPRVPDFKGLERFKGEWHHSGMWPQDGVDFTGKRVALIGTGATGIQMVPKIAAQAKQLYVFQRTANYSVPARNTPMPADMEREHKLDYEARRKAARRQSFGVSRVPLPTQAAHDVSAEERQQIYAANWAAGGSIYFLTAFKDLLTDGAANETAAEFVRERIREMVRDPRKAELLTPTDHPIGTKRLCVDTEYYEAFNRDNLHLVDVRSAPIQEITETGIRTGDTVYEVDAIAFATGFDAMTGALREIAITGRGGVTLAQKWEHGPTTYLGLMVHGFPNLFIVTGPGSPSVKSNMITAIEQHVEWIADCLSDMQRQGAATIEPEADAETHWGEHVNEVAHRTLYPRAASWYTGSNIPGKPKVFMPYVAGIPAYIQICEAVVADGYRGFTVREQPPAAQGHAA